VTPKWGCFFRVAAFSHSRAPSSLFVSYGGISDFHLPKQSLYQRDDNEIVEEPSQDLSGSSFIKWWYHRRPHVEIADSPMRY
jgi:hypothetical protein